MTCNSMDGCFVDNKIGLKIKVLVISKNAYFNPNDSVVYKVDSDVKFNSYVNGLNFVTLYERISYL